MATKDFITYSPTSGNKNATIDVIASNNTGAARSTSLNISAKGITKSISITQKIIEVLVLQGMNPVPTNLIEFPYPIKRGESLNINQNLIFGGQLFNFNLPVQFSIDRTIPAGFNVQIDKNDTLAPSLSWVVMEDTSVTILISVKLRNENNYLGIMLMLS